MRFSISSNCSVNGDNDHEVVKNVTDLNEKIIMSKRPHSEMRITPLIKGGTLIQR